MLEDTKVVAEGITLDAEIMLIRHINTQILSLLSAMLILISINSQGLNKLEKVFLICTLLMKCVTYLYMYMKKLCIFALFM